MLVSQQVPAWQAQARVEGRIEGRAEGEVERLRAVILRALELRFRSAVPADLAAAVAGIADVEELSRWLDRTQTSDSLEDFRAAVRVRFAPGYRSLNVGFRPAFRLD